VPTRTQEPEPKPEAARDVAWDVIKKIMVVVMKKERRTVKKEEERREEQESKKRNQVLIRPEKAQGVCGRRR
jgi:hypothetical protein